MRLPTGKPRFEESHDSPANTLSFQYRINYSFSCELIEQDIHGTQANSIVFSNCADLLSWKNLRIYAAETTSSELQTLPDLVKTMDPC